MKLLGILQRCNRISFMGLLLVLTACGESGTEEGRQQGNRGPGGPGGPGQFAQNMIPAVEVVRAELGTLPLEERLTGRVTAKNQTEIYSEVSGPVTEIFAENGDYVEEGTPLLQIRDSEIAERHQQAISGLEIAEAQQRQAQANLELLTTQMNRIQGLRDLNLETASVLETIQSQVAVARADLDLRVAQRNQAASVLEERRLQLRNTTVRAPVSGRIGRRNAERGSLVTTGTPLFTIGDLSQIQIEVLLTERMLSYIEVGTPVNLYSESWTDTSIPSEITRISPFLDTTTMRTVAHIDVGNPNGLLRSGMFITVDILYGQSEEAVLIPNSAFYRHPRTGVEGIYVVSAPNQEIEPLVGTDQITPPLPVAFVPVRVLATGRMASGVTGVKAGDLVVTVGQNLLTDNVPQTQTRLVTWERMMELQQMQSRDIFQVIDRQQQQARSDGT